MVRRVEGLKLICSPEPGKSETRVMGNKAVPLSARGSCIVSPCIVNGCHMEMQAQGARFSDVARKAGYFNVKFPILFYLDDSAIKH